MTNAGRSASVLRGVGWLGAASLLQTFLRVALFVALARLVTPEAYGVIALATAAVACVEIVCRFGVESALIQTDAVTPRLLAEGAGSALLLSIAGAALLFAFAEPLAYHLGGGITNDLASVIRLLSLTLPVTALAMPARAWLSRQARFGVLAQAEIFSFSFASLFVAVPLAAVGWGVWALSSAAIAQSVAAAALHTIWARNSMRWAWPTSAVGDLFRFGVPFTIAKIANYVALQADNIVVGRYLGLSALGAYNRAYALSALPATMLAQSVDRSLFPVMSRAQTDLPAIRRGLIRGLVPLFVIFPPASAYCFVYAEELILLALGRQWNGAVIPFQVLAWSMYFRVAYKVPDIAIRANGRTDLLMRLHLIYALLVVFGAVMAVDFGLGGVALAVSAAIIWHYGQTLFLASRLVGLEVKRLVKIHLYAVSTALLSLAVFSLFDHFVLWLGPNITLGLAFVLLLALYVILLPFAQTLYGQDGEWWYIRARGTMERAFLWLYQRSVGKPD